MVNITEMAKPFGKHKLPEKWLRTQRTQDLIKDIADAHKCASVDLVQVIKGNFQNKSQGTWMHQEQALH